MASFLFYVVAIGLGLVASYYAFKLVCFIIGGGIAVVGYSVSGIFSLISSAIKKFFYYQFHAPTVISEGFALDYDNNSYFWAKQTFFALRKATYRGLFRVMLIAPIYVWVFIVALLWILYACDVFTFKSEIWLYAQIGFAVTLGVCVLLMVIAAVLAVLHKLAEKVLNFVDASKEASYNIHNICPYCQGKAKDMPKDKYVRYFSKSKLTLATDDFAENILLNFAKSGATSMNNATGSLLNRKLRPSKYGLFSMRHQNTDDKIPTTLSGGRVRWPFRCAKCDKKIEVSMGTDKHIMLAGGSGSGKSSLIAALMGEWGRNRDAFLEGPVESTPPDLVLCYKDMKENAYLSQFPKKTTSGDKPSIVLNIKRKHSAIPYTVYFDDVAGGDLIQGEKSFTCVANTNVILFLIDPSTSSLSDIIDAHSSVINLFRDSGRIDDVTMYYILVKTDLYKKNTSALLAKRRYRRCWLMSLGVAL